MRAAVLVAPGRIEIQDRPDPVPGPEEALVRVSYAGICGTDLALHAGSYETELPLVPGHEMCGVVVDTGAGVSPDLVGAEVTTEVSVTCVTRREQSPCAACRLSMPSQCLRRRSIGIRGRDGAFAELLAVPAAGLHRLPKDLSAWAGVLVEPVAAAIQTFELSPIERSDTVVVLGAGRLGLLVCRVARSFGSRVIAVSRSERSRALALRFGADEALAPEEAYRIRKATEGLGADVVVECTGDPEGLAIAADLVRPRGVVALKSTCGRHATGLATTELVVKEVTVQGSRCGPFLKAIERLKVGQIPVDDYVSGVYPLEDVVGAFDASRRAAKILLEVSP